MSTARRGLGRGLEVLVGGRGDATELVQLPVAEIASNERQPRRGFAPESTAELAQSITHHGLLQPVVVRPKPGGGYELIAGERRWRAAREAGLESVPALVRTADDRDSLLLALVENVARENLSAVEEARAYAVLVDEFALSLGDVAERVGRSKSAVSNRMRLLELPDEVLWMIARGELSEGHARAVLALPNHDERTAFARRIRAAGMSVRGAERAARESGARTKTRRKAPVDPDLARRAREAAERLTGLGARVRGDRVEIAFADEAELAELVEALEALTAPQRAARPSG